MAGACNKDGNFYALRTDTMRPVWAVHVGLGTPAGELACLSGGIWDGRNLYVTGNDTVVGGAWTKTTQTSASGYSWPLYVPIRWNREPERDPQARSGDRTRRQRLDAEADLGGGEPPSGARHLFAQRPGHADRVPDD